MVQRMDDPDKYYAIAVPKIPQFINQCSKVPAWVREALNILILLIDDKGEVQTITPQDTTPM